jgi:hypothetical protein
MLGYFINMIKNKNSIYFLILVAVFIAFITYFFIKKDEPKKEVFISLKDYLLSNFLSELPDINKKLPHKIDNETSLMSINYENNKILSVYEITSVEISSELVKKIEPALKKQICDDEMKRKFLNVDIEFLNRYQNPAGVMIFETLVSRDVCSKL